jgi:hypothetical protein
MNIGVCMIAYNRPECLDSVVRSLEANPESGDYPFHFFLDGGPDATQDANERIIRESRIRDARVVPRERHWGCEANTIRAHDTLFVENGYDVVMCLEDDLVVSPHYLGLLKRMLAWATDRFENVASVQAWDRCLLPRDDKARRLHLVGCRSTSVHWWGYAVTRRAWERMRPLVCDYEERFARDADGGIDDAAVRSFIYEAADREPEAVGGTVVPFEAGTREGFLHPNVATGNDTIHALAMWQAGLVRLCTVVNRALPVGRVGVHCTGEQFEAMGLHRVQLDVFDEDRTLSEFELVI